MRIRWRAAAAACARRAAAASILAGVRTAIMQAGRQAGAHLACQLQVCLEDRPGVDVAEGCTDGDWRHSDHQLRPAGRVSSKHTGRPEKEKNIRQPEIRPFWPGSRVPTFCPRLVHATTLCRTQASSARATPSGGHTRAPTWLSACKPQTCCRQTCQVHQQCPRAPSPAATRCASQSPRAAQTAPQHAPRPAPAVAALGLRQKLHRSAWRWCGCR